MPKIIARSSFRLASAALLVLAWSPDGTASDRAFRFRLNGDPVTLDWNLAHTSNETPILMNIMEGLAEEGGDLTPHPALAERWELSADGKTYVFHLRTDVQWSDGKPLKAADFVASWLRLLDPKTAASYASFLFDIDNAEAFHSGKLKDRSKVGLRALDDRRFQVTLRRPVPYFVHLTTFWVTYPIRAELISKYGAAWSAPEHLVTLGAYRVSSWEKGKRLVLTKNPKYRAPDTFRATSPETVEATIEPNEKKARTLFFDAHATDALLNPTTEDLVRAPKGGARVAQFPYLATYYLGLTSTTAPLDSPKIRRALLVAAAEERTRIPAELQGGQTPAGGWLPPGIPGHDPAAKPEGSLFEARQLLSKAGYTEGRGFPKLRLYVERFDGAETLGRVLAAAFKQKLGIESDVTVPAPSEFQDLLKKGGAPAFVTHWGADYADPATFFETFLSKSGTNYLRMKSGAYDSLVASALDSQNSSVRATAYMEAEKILTDREAVLLPLFYKRNSALLGANVDKLEITPLNYLFFKNIELKANKD